MSRETEVRSAEDRPQLTVLEGGVCGAPSETFSEQFPEIGDAPQLFAGEEAGAEEGPYPDFPEIVGTESEPAPEPIPYDMMAMQIAAHVQRLLQEGQRPQYLLAPADLEEGLRAAMEALPEEAYPQALKEQLPLHFAPDVTDLRVVTLADLESQFLQRYYGPREIGGTGLIPRLAQYAQERGEPVQITIDFLRNRYLGEVCDRILPRIEVPNGAQIQRHLLRTP